MKEKQKIEVSKRNPDIGILEILKYVVGRKIYKNSGDKWNL